MRDTIFSKSLARSLLISLDSPGVLGLGGVLSWATGVVGAAGGVVGGATRATGDGGGARDTGDSILEGGGSSSTTTTAIGSCFNEGMVIAAVPPPSLSSHARSSASLSARRSRMVDLTIFIRDARKDPSP